MKPTPYAKQLKRRREALGWKPETLAFHAGMTGQQVRNIEAGRTRQPRDDTVRDLEKALAKGERRQAQRKGAA